MSKNEMKQSTINFLKEFYNQEIIDEAIQYAESAYNIEDTFSKLISDIIKENLNKDNIDKEVINGLLNTIVENESNSIMERIPFTYLQGIERGVNLGESANIYRELTSDYTKNKDFAFYFNFHDNDFGGYIFNAAKKYCNEYNSLLQQYDRYIEDTKGKSTCNLSGQYQKDIEYMETSDNVIEIMKTLFIGEYMSQQVDRVAFFNRKKEFSTETNINEANRYIDYLQFYVDNHEFMGKIKTNWIFGTFDEVYNKVCKQNDKDVTDITKEWFNGEVLIVKMVNGRLTASIH